MGIWIKDRNYSLMSYVLSYTWEWVSIGKLLVGAYLSEHNVPIKSLSGMVDSIYKFSDYSSVQHAPCCRLHHRQTEGKTRKENNKKKIIRRGGLQWGIHLVKLGQGARNVWVKTTAFFGEGGRLLLMLFLLCCQCAVWSYCQRLCSLYNSWIDGGLFPGGLGRRWRRGLAGQRRWNMLRTDKTVTLKLPFSQMRATWLATKIKKSNWLTGLFIQGLKPGSAHTTFLSFKVVTLSDYGSLNCQTTRWTSTTHISQSARLQRIEQEGQATALLALQQSVAFHYDTQNVVLKLIFFLNTPHLLDRPCLGWCRVAWSWHNARHLNLS